MFRTTYQQKGSPMSAPTTADRPARKPGRGATAAKGVAVVAAVAALGFGAAAITKNDPSGTATAANGRPPAGAQNGGPPGGMGTAVTGSTLTKLKAVATAKYPGTVERAMKLPDGSYVVHVIRSGNQGEVHVLVSKAFKITGTETGGPGGGAPPSGTTPPSGQSAPSSSSS
jgi:hypothetical protein